MGDICILHLISHNLNGTMSYKKKKIFWCPNYTDIHYIGAGPVLLNWWQSQSQRYIKPNVGKIFFQVLESVASVSRFFLELEHATLWVRCQSIIVERSCANTGVNFSWPAWLTPHASEIPTIPYWLNSALFSRLPPIGPHFSAGPHSRLHRF